MEKDLDHQKELQLLPPPPVPPPPRAPSSSSRALPWFHHHRRSRRPPLYPLIDGGDDDHDHNHDHDHHHNNNNNEGPRPRPRPRPSLDLKLSISLEPAEGPEFGCVEALKWQAAEQIRLAAIEKAYAERVRELTRREIELAHSEFARARAMWDKAREEVAKAERLRDSATSCMGHITCHSCRQRFRAS